VLPKLSEIFNTLENGITSKGTSGVSSLKNLFMLDGGNDEDFNDVNSVDLLVDEIQSWASFNIITAVIII